MLAPLRLTVVVSVVIGFMMLAPAPAPRYLLAPNATRRQLRVFDLLRPSGPGVAVLHGDEMRAMTAALSADGESICLGCYNPGALRVYDTAPLLVAAATLLEGNILVGSTLISIGQNSLLRCGYKLVLGRTHCSGTNTN